MDTTIESSTQTRNPILAYTDREKPNLEAAAKFISALSANGVVTF